MANEIRVTASLSCDKSNARLGQLQKVQRIDMTGDVVLSNTQEVGTSEEELIQGADLGTPGWVYLENLDSTNFIRAGLTGSYTIKLKAGEACVFRFAGAALYAIADTAACKVFYAIIED